VVVNAGFETLVQRYLDGSIAAGEMAALNAALESDASLRREFADWLNLDASLGTLAKGLASGIGAAPGPEMRRSSSIGKRGRPRSLGSSLMKPAALAASIILAAVGWWFWQGNAPAFAVVEEETGSAGLPPGLRLRGEARRIAAGTVKLRTRRGAELVIEAPAAFRFESPQRLHLETGRLSAEVPPPATGFTVITPDGDAVDLGTRFGIDVTGQGRSEIHVFEGEVVARLAGASAPLSLRGGEAFSMRGREGDGRELRDAAFIGGEEMSALRAALEAGQESRAAAANAALRRDPALIALLTFEDPEAASGVFREVQGRWPGSRATEFAEAGDHLVLDAGGGREWPQLTLAAWVRLDRLGAPYQSLLHTDGWSEDNPGQVHWMISGDATMRLALRGNKLAPGSDERHGFPDSRTPVLPGRGCWVHLAVVYDSAKGTVRFYLNGRFDKETRQSTAHPARLGPARIGNWDRQDRKLSGRIDELLLLGRAMEDAEIKELYEAGTPYR
jgi:hypothetical protein